jgi:dolichol-phosphate mannosyltransferase
MRLAAFPAHVIPNNMKLSVISPTLNEADNVPRLVQRLEQALTEIDYEILIVDDDSADRTWSVAQQLSLTNPRVRALRRVQNPGLGLAVIDGFSAADGEILACIDADLQHDPAILPAMLEGLQRGADIVVGSRHIAGGSTGDWNRWRRMQSWLATKTAQLLLGVTLKDPMSGYFLMRREDFSAVKEQLKGDGFKILLEMLANLQSSGIAEVPYTFQARIHGASKLSNRVIFQYVQQLWRLCSTSRHRSVRFMKSAMVGGVGIFANLAIMSILLAVTHIVDWRASALACLGANLQNYLLNHYWTYPARAKRGYEEIGSYASYLMKSIVGMAVTVISYGLLNWRFDGIGGAFALDVRLACEFLAVLVGVGFHYLMNQLFAGPDFVRMNFDPPESGTPSFIELTERRRFKNLLDLDPEVGK